MEKTTPLNSRIKHYLALASGVTTAISASAQVIHTDLNPDTVLTYGGNNQYNLDFNGADTDITFEVNQTTLTSVFTYFFQPVDVRIKGAVANFDSSAPITNGFMGSLTSFSGQTLMLINNLSSGNPIGNSQSFVQNEGAAGADITAMISGGTVYGPINVGNHSSTPGFVGVRFDISGSVHYGWARISYDSPTQMTIYEYAYETTPNTPISAGDKVGSSSVEELYIDRLVTVNSLANRVVVESDVTNGLINVVSVNGQNVASKTIIENRETLDLNGLAAGIYVINITADQGSITKKIYIR